MLSMSDATHLLKGTALNTMADEDSATPIIRCALDEKRMFSDIDSPVAPSRASGFDPPFLAEGSKQVCSDPPIWVFDDLLSDVLLERVDASFDGIQWQTMNGRTVRMVELSIDDQLLELTETLRDISHIEDVSPCGKAWIMDVHGRNQGAHVDGWELEKSRKSMQLLDLSKCCVQSHNGFKTVIPTLSFVIYFNDSGGIAFPKAALAHPTIPAKRGRIVMFSNYDDLHRPAHNPKAVHYGVYDDVAKRVMTAGVMSSETPAALLGSQPYGAPKTKGFLYAPIMHRSNTACGNDTPPTPPPKPAAAAPKPRPVIQLFARAASEGGFMVEAKDLAGSTRAKGLLESTATLGELRKWLGIDAQLVVQDSMLDGPDSMPIRETVLIKGFLDMGGLKDALPTSMKADSVPETLVEWDVIDTVFVERPKDQRSLPSIASGIAPPELQSFGRHIQGKQNTPESDSVDAYLECIYQRTVPEPETKDSC